MEHPNIMDGLKLACRDPALHGIVGFWEAKEMKEDFISAVTRGRQTRFAVAAILFKPKYNRRPIRFVLSCQNAVEYPPT
jgi:hypothetical protein